MARSQVVPCPEPVDAIKAAEALCSEKGLKARRLFGCDRVPIHPIVHAAVDPFWRPNRRPAPAQTKLPCLRNADRIALLGESRRPAASSPGGGQIAHLGSVSASRSKQCNACGRTPVRRSRPPARSSPGSSRTCSATVPSVQYRCDNKRANPGLTQFLSSCLANSASPASPLDLARPCFADTTAAGPACTARQSTRSTFPAPITTRPYLAENGCSRTPPCRNAAPTMKLQPAAAAPVTPSPTAAHPRPPLRQPS